MNWYTTLQASELLKTSVKKVQRETKKHKNNPLFVSKEGQKYAISNNFILFIAQENEKNVVKNEYSTTSQRHLDDTPATLLSDILEYTKPSKVILIELEEYKKLLQDVAQLEGKLEMFDKVISTKDNHINSLEIQLESSRSNMKEIINLVFSSVSTIKEFILEMQQKNFITAKDKGYDKK